jgi:tetratricopeptide (TPR) repeat protein
MELLALARAEQRRRWRLGERARVEDFLQECPALRDDPEILLDLVYSEFVLRHELGEAPALEEFLDRFPEQADGLRHHLDLHAAIAGGFLQLRALRGRPPRQTLGPRFPSIPGTAGPEKAEARAGDSLARPSIPNYEILEILGTGGMGIVYKARQITLSRTVALKMILHAEKAGPALHERFRIEAEAVARLQHPNIVQVYEVGRHNGVPFFSQEFCAGGSLDKRLRGVTLSPAEAAAMAETLARAIHAAHHARVIHRDLKPANVLLAEGRTIPLTQCTLKIGDFGLAKKLDASTTGPTRPGGIVGSPPYMSPEQARAEGTNVGPAADVYSLGAILYEFLTGRPPFLADSIELTLFRVLGEDPVPVRRLRPRTPRDLETICHKCLEKDPKKRYATAEALADDLRRFRSGEPVIARPAGTPERALKWARRRPTAAALAMVSFLVFLGLLIAVPLVIARLRAVADMARADANRSRAFAEAQRTRAICVQWLRQAELALNHGDAGVKGLEEARRLFTAARDRIGPHEALENPDLRELRADAERQLEALDRRMLAWEGLLVALRQRDRALFLLYGDAFTETDPQKRAGWRKAAHEAAHEALTRHGWPDEMLVRAGQAPLADSQKKALRQTLYELCLVMAEAAAPLPEQPAEQREHGAAEALSILHQAEALVAVGRLLHLRRARYLDLLGHAKAACRERSLADAQEPRTALDWFFEGCDRAFVEDRLPEALVCLEKALGAQPDLFWPHFFRAVVCQKLQKTVEARSGLTVCAVFRPDFPWTYLLRGSLAGQAGEFAAAADDFVRADRLLPSTDHSARYILLVNRGFVALCQRDCQKAITDLEEAVRLRPDLYHAYVNLGEARALQKDFGRAVGHLDQAIQLHPRLGVLYSTRARMHLCCKDRRAALGDLDQAIRLATLGGQARVRARDHRERSLVLYQERRYPQALLACEEAIALNPDDPASHRLQGEINLQLGCYEEALAAFDRALKSGHTRGDAELFRQRGRARARLHDSGGAAEEYTQALKLGPDADTLCARGWAMLDADAPRLALADFAEALRQNPHSGDAYSGRGFARVRLGDHRGATDAEEALRHGSRCWQQCFSAARVFALAAGVVEAQQPADARQLLERYRERAVACLRLSLELFPPHEQLTLGSRLLRDPVFLPLCANSAFTRLVKEYAPQP